MASISKHNIIWRSSVINNFDVLSQFQYWKTQRNFSRTATNLRSYETVIIGAGTGGICVANLLKNTLRKSGKFKSGSIGIIEPEEFHYYQPGWTLVGCGLAKKESLRRSVDSIIPSGITRISERVARIDPRCNSIVCDNSETISYSQLVVSAGLTPHWDYIPGLETALKTEKVSSIYSYELCDKTWDMINGFKRGNAVFTMTPGPIKCAGAPQKIMWMAEDYWKRSSLRNNIDINYHTPLATMFAVRKYSEFLRDEAQKRNVKTNYKSAIKEVNSRDQTVTFKTETGDITEPYDILHVTPPLRPPRWIADSNLSDEAGFVDVNQNTLQSIKYDNIWALGDCSNLCTSKTAAAIMSQAPVLVHNLRRKLEQTEPDASYGGYTSCPILINYGKLLLAEFKYGNEVDETFPWMNQASPNRFFYHLKKNIFPAVYFGPFIQGHWYGRNGLVPPRLDLTANSLHSASLKKQ